jgi:hypothetical protein
LEWTNQQPIISHIDTNGDQFASPLDALLVINYLNRRVGEGETNVFTPAPVFWLAGLWDGTEEKTSPAAEEDFDPSLDTLTSPSRFLTTNDSA